MTGETIPLTQYEEFKMSKMMGHSPGWQKRAMFRLLSLTLAAAMAVFLAGCGSTKVYSVQKNVVYNGALYNVSNIKVMASSVEARLDNGTTLNLEKADKKKFNEYVGNYGALPVKMVIAMDGQELVYAAGAMDSYSNFDKTRKRFNSAQKSISKFMADKKKTQLKLK